MAERGRKSAASLSVVKPVQELAKIPPAPDHLTGEQSDTWRIVVESRAGDMIDPEAYPVLVEYCRAVSAANALAVQINTLDLSWAADEEGLKRWDKLLAMQARVAGTIATLGGKLRINPSARIRADAAGVAASKGKKLKPWQVDNKPGAT